MQFYHHPLSLHSQKARLALEEKEIDYWPINMNPLKCRNLEPDFFGQYPNARLPILINGSRVIIGSLHVVQYVDSFNRHLGGDKVNLPLAKEWMQNIDSWDPKLFTLSNIPEKYRQFFSRFKRQVVISRMAENPDLASQYHEKLQSMHALEKDLKDEAVINENKNELVSLLNCAEDQLGSTQYLAGDAFSMADAMFLPLLGRIELLKLDTELIKSRVKLDQYWEKAKTRPSYQVVIGKYSTNLGKFRVLGSSVLNMKLRTLFKRY
ncbi:hypothetical protein O6H91_10G037300 [Diphasiastrum complanatum]|uniref:Uncharacterized protein n=6 Tax=Diphasiastrum complanatum TaxID=34168 RepID=A0ACC2CFW8_DIPCM|nr:hypothetical protein O6H91_10G035000 [Diphasiastrum complanatum]KAJ7540882.1 hypothetical protein O6H91_10G035000 [Diphasiastrum complanatum]KAJ7540883.1 hypothetical protein O6H91_10G035000 [Diphasiastrum complanatum]KAJ7540939.1 hypothetical protein O6H91_10G037300 [Diphasiastrum complanatum]KAJ7540940.1 hypothetical protein O6H91_10G037300 [Diphasiastrum complanatum]